MNLVRHTCLRFKKGETSDKVYEVDLVETAGDYLVNFRYGKFGANLREGCKTKTPVDQTEATKIANSLLVSKINKGYWVEAGYDPVNDTFIGEQTVGDRTTDTAQPTETQTSKSNDASNSNAGLDHKIIKRLENFSQGSFVRDKRDDNLQKINGYSLGRTIWKVGELRIKTALPALIKVLKSDNINKQPLDYYSILWAFGRIGDVGNESILALIDTFEKKLPENTGYMVTEVKMALTNQPAQFIPTYDDTINQAEMVSEVAQFDKLEKQSFETLSDSDSKYVDKVLELHGLTADVANALKQLKIEDALISDDIKENRDATNEGVNAELTADLTEDTDGFPHYVVKYLSPQSVSILRKNEAAYPKLLNAIEKLLDNKKNILIAEKSKKYQADYDLYMSLIARIDLNTIFDNNADDVSYAQHARLDWIWGSEKKALIKALKKTGKVDNAKKLWKRVEKYSDLTSDTNVEISPKQINEYQQILKEANVYDDVNAALDMFSLNDYQWLFMREQLSVDTQCKYEEDVAYEVNRKFQHQFYHLRAQALKPKQALLDTHQLSALGVYWASLADDKHRNQAIAVIRNTPVKQPFTQTFRRFYKIAEFRDDSEALAILNYRIEATKPSLSSYWETTPKPFSKATKEYFRRRMVRTLRNIGKFQPQHYLQYSVDILLQADDADTELANTSNPSGSVYFPKLSALNYILHHHSSAFSKNYLGIWRFDKNAQETARPEAYPKLWDKAESELLALLIACKSVLVNDFAFTKFKTKTAYLEKINQQDWIKLVQRPYENTALLALDHLQNDLNNTQVMIAVLASPFVSVRKKALDALNGETLGENLDLLVIMLLSNHDDVYEFAQSYLYTAQENYTELSDRLLAELMALDTSEADSSSNSPNNTKEAQKSNYLKRIEWLLLHPLKGKASLASITPLLTRPEFEYQLLATKLLEVSNYSFAELEESYTLMSQSKYPEIRAGAIALLAKLSTAEKIKHKDLLFKALVDEHPALRKKSREVIAGIDDQPFRIETFDYILPTFFKAEPVDGFADDMLEVVVVLEPMHTEVDSDLLWRLLNAKSKLAQWVGALILSSRSADDFSVKQLALLTKNPTVSVRDWALDKFESDLSLTTNNFSEAIRILDNRWDDSRQRAIQFFQNNFDQNTVGQNSSNQNNANDSFWNSQRTIAVCDNVYPDVQRFGRDLVTRFFTEDQGEEYLIKLSQHPSANVQLFVSGFLKEYASDQVAIILSLQPYFRTVLSQVNRGRLIKDRVIQFLFNEAQKDDQVAKMVAALFTDQSISKVIADKMQYIKTLYQLQTQHSHINTPVITIEPEVRSI